ncbi:MAG: restriction endonuclease subunit S [Nitrospira sp.]|nr:restriction endonuclease subunit S [Nitrospira sp.]
MKKGWPTKTLGQLCQLISGQHIEAKDYNTESRGVGYLTGPSDFGPLNPVISKWTEHPKVKAKCGDVLITVKGSGVGKINLLDQDEVAISRQLMAVRVTGADSRFVHAILSSTFDHFQSLSTGAAIPGISREQVLGLKIALPPLPEQQRIVGILDEAFEGLATATANAEKNLHNARALFESHLQSVFTQRGKGWVEKTLGDVCEFENGDRGKNYPNRHEYVQSGIPWINTGHIQPDGTLSMKEMNFITREKFDSLRSGKIQTGDLVYCLRGATLGKTAFVDPLTEGAVASSLVIVRPSSLLDSKFLYFFLTSPFGQGLIKGFENGAAQPNLGARSVAKYPIPIPPAVDQRRIAERLMDLRQETKRLESIYQQKLAALDELKKSLLHQAFAGQL